MYYQPNKYKHWYRQPVVFVNQRLYLLTMRTRILEHNTFKCQLQYVLAVFGHHQVDCTVKYMEKIIEGLLLYTSMYGQYSTSVLFSMYVAVYST
jgi:hypothetical protein